MFILDKKKNIFIIEGKYITEKNQEIYRNASVEYIKNIKKYEKLGEEINNAEDINIIKQSEFEEKYNELINEEFLDIKFSGEDYIDNKLYVD